MNNFAELSEEEGKRFLLRWRGRQEGPYAAAEIEEKLAANEIGLLHEILHEDKWVSIRDYLAAREAVLLARRQAREEAERLARQEVQRQKELEESRIRAQAGPSAQDSRRRELLESAVLAALKPKYPKWPWILSCICVLVWYSWSEAESKLVSEARRYISASEEMKSSEYQFGKGLEAFLRGYAGDPFGVAAEELAKAEAINSELRRIDSEYQTARNAASFWFLALLVTLGLGIWRHRSHKKAIRPFDAAAKS